MMCLVYKKLINKGVVFIKKVLKMLELIKVGTLTKNRRVTSYTKVQSLKFTIGNQNLISKVD